MSESDFDVQIRVVTDNIQWQLDQIHVPFLPIIKMMDEDFLFIERLLWPYRDTWRKEQMRGRAMKHRLYNRIYAFLNGYFWLPCPNCGQMFGGHEWDGADFPDPLDCNHGYGICNDCDDAGVGRRLWEASGCYEKWRKEDEAMR